MMLLGLASCQATSGYAIDPTAVKGISAASYCAVTGTVDLRASRKDTPPTQRTLYQLQQARKGCPV